jgi:phosphoenolpyruvate synthase/pyruvate phosphate dikinase
MKTFECSLTIVFPKALEEELIDYLLEQPEWVRGFTISQVEGKGTAVRLSGVVEEVRGRARRVQVQTILDCEDAHALIARLKELLPNPEVAYWVSPILEFGRFA